MCGICGVVGRTVSDEQLVAAMAKMGHRGPDQEGRWRCERAVLGHRRLSIIDLSADGRQPMTNETRSVWLSYNGEVYNFQDLRRQLEGRHTFRSHTDSEVLVHGYEEWGIDGLLERIRGMFAFALWDQDQGTLHLARDHLGKKPLYYTAIGGGVTFASTLPALLELLGGTPNVERAAILDYLTYQCVPAPMSMFEGVFKLPPAHRLEHRKNGEVRLLRYWRPDFSQKESRSEEEWLDQIDELLRDSVRERLVADVPLGAFLSGGVDSSLIVALMTELSGRPVTTISMGFAEQQYDELPHARQVASVCRSDHHEHVLRPDAPRVLPALVFHYGEPFADNSALATYYLAQIAREHVTVVLTGDGGDENFGGYLTMPAVAVAYALRWVPGLREGYVAGALRALARRGLKWARQLRWVAEIGKGHDANYVFDPVGVRSFREVKQCVVAEGLRDTLATRDSDLLYRQLWNEAGDLDWVDRALYVDMLAYLPNDLMVKTDVATMAHSVEARCPFLDRRLVELACRIPPRLKLRRFQTKHLLKRLAERYLPANLLYRRKQGFAMPVTEWFRSDLKGLLEPLLLHRPVLEEYLRRDMIQQFIGEHTAGTMDHGHRLWMLVVLELWFRMFVRRELSPTDALGAIL